MVLMTLGIDYMLPALGGGFGKGYKVVTGYDLVGDQYNGDNTPVPDPDPLDACGAGSGASGHGTHVSGIIAGEDETIVSKEVFMHWADRLSRISLAWLLKRTWPCTESLVAKARREMM